MSLYGRQLHKQPIKQRILLSMILLYILDSRHNKLAPQLVQYRVSFIPTSHRPLQYQMNENRITGYNHDSVISSVIELSFILLYSGVCDVVMATLRSRCAGGMAV